MCCLYILLYLDSTYTHTHMPAAQLTRDGLVVEADPANYIVTDQHEELHFREFPCSHMSISLSHHVFLCVLSIVSTTRCMVFTTQPDTIVTLPSSTNKPRCFLAFLPFPSSLHCFSFHSCSCLSLLYSSAWTAFFKESSTLLVAKALSQQTTILPFCPPLDFFGCSRIA